MAPAWNSSEFRNSFTKLLLDVPIIDDESWDSKQCSNSDIAIRKLDQGQCRSLIKRSVFRARIDAWLLKIDSSFEYIDCLRIRHLGWILQTIEGKWRRWFGMKMGRQWNFLQGLPISIPPTLIPRPTGEFRVTFRWKDFFIVKIRQTTCKLLLRRSVSLRQTRAADVGLIEFSTCMHKRLHSANSIRCLCANGAYFSPRECGLWFLDRPFYSRDTWHATGLSGRSQFGHEEHELLCDTVQAVSVWGWLLCILSLEAAWSSCGWNETIWGRCQIWDGIVADVSFSFLLPAEWLFCLTALYPCFSVSDSACFQQRCTNQISLAHHERSSTKVAERSPSETISLWEFLLEIFDKACTAFQLNFCCSLSGVTLISQLKSRREVDSLWRNKLYPICRGQNFKKVVWKDRRKVSPYMS